ncbi:hypothetical protein [Mucilaginibacter pedocola]|uniref:Uncharacterized protein n=1 Tax=Mucilaginibacter pedocola TaxID=1792845 RepID=A0A1S9PLZ2_9SPHI|nr:hypothetical protein [Mucilaginibacter pedocola]OOQ61949.1 hypothetical protein BC343_02490 [Mucilaginibacter pedocola]
MKFFKDKHTCVSENQASDRAAMAIAHGILCLQKRLATAVNLWFNGFSHRQQKCILGLIGVALATWLLTTINGPFNAFSKQSKVPYSAVHIGQPSDLPKPKHGQKQFTDSLTIK